MKGLCDLRDWLHTLTSIFSGFLCEPRFLTIMNIRGRVSCWKPFAS